MTMGRGLAARAPPTALAEIWAADCRFLVAGRQDQGQYKALKDVPGTSAQKALRFVLDHPHVDAAVIGLAELDHLAQALAVTTMAPLSDTARRALEACGGSAALHRLRRGDRERCPRA